MSNDRLALQNRLNELAVAYGFRAFTFGADKKETALRAVARFVKSQAGRIQRGELPGDAQQHLVALDVLGQCLRSVIGAPEAQLERLTQRLNLGMDQLIAQHAQNIIHYLQTVYPRQAQQHMAVLVKAALAQVKLAATPEAKQLAEEHLQNVRTTETSLKAALANLQAQLVTATAAAQPVLVTAAQALTLKADILKQHPWPFNPSVVAAAEKNLATAEQALKTQAAQAAQAKPTKKSPAATAGFKDQGGQNDQIAAQLAQLLKRD